MPFIASVRGNYGAQGRFGKLPSLVDSTGGVITTAGGYRIHTFTTTGTTSFVAGGSGTVEYLVIAAGGSYEDRFNHGQGGSGAGGYLSGTLPVTAGQSYTVTVGSHVAFSNGENSVFGSVTTIGGGRGRGFTPGVPGGSGSGNGHDCSTTPEGAGTPGQGNRGGHGYGGGSWGAGGGGGGAGGVGGNSPSPASTPGGPGGAGLASSITGTSVTRAGGGGAGGHGGGGPGASGGTGGDGGGGPGGVPSGNPGSPGTVNTGGGGGGGPHDGGPAGKPGGTGGPGIVVVRYTI